MVSKSSFYDYVKVHLDKDQSLGKRIQSLLDNIVERLPDEEQFQIKGVIGFNSREQALEFWNHMKNSSFMIPDLSSTNKNGNCTYNLAETIEDSNFIITIIVDELNERSDEYVKGLIAHEISEMSYAWRNTKAMQPQLRKLKPKAREIILDRIIHHNAPIGSKEHQKHEDAVNQEAIRLGFENEIIELEKF